MSLPRLVLEGCLRRLQAAGFFERMRRLVLILRFAFALPAASTVAHAQAIRVALAKQSFSPTGTSTGPTTMADGGIQSLLAKMGATIRVDESKLMATQDTEYGAWKRLGWALGDFARIVARNEHDGYFTVGLYATCPSMPGMVAGLEHSGPNGRPLRIGMLWLDAHPDFNTPETTRSGNMGGMPVAIATGRALTNLRLDATLDPPVRDEDVVMGGVRLVDPLEQSLLDHSKIQRLSVDDIRRGTPAVWAQLDRLVSQVDKFYVHVDMDVLDPREVSMHVNPVPGGPSSEELAALFERIFARYPKAAAIGFATIPPSDPGGLAIAALNRMIVGAVKGVQRRGSHGGDQAPPAATGRLVADTVHSAAIENNKYGDSPNRSVLVYLPPSYESNPTRRFPVVYLLHGYGSTEQSWVRGYAGFNIQRAMDSLVAAAAVKEMILVMPNARDFLRGSFYTNSASDGGWDDFISRELVAYIDRKYRTLARPQSRGLGGHSMGGYGTFYLAMLHGGDVYGAAYSLSGCCTRFNTGLTPGAEQLWARLASLSSLSEARDLDFIPSVYLALAAAFSPNPDRPPLYVDLPFEQKDGRWQKVDAVQAEWAEHSPYDMVPSHASHLKRLAGFAFDVGTRDELVAPASLAQLDSAFTRAGVPHTYETYDGTHTSHIGERMITSVLPFFSRTLGFDAPK